MSQTDVLLAQIRESTAQVWKNTKAIEELLLLISLTLTVAAVPLALILWRVW
jgi:hypothetical protein